MSDTGLYSGIYQQLREYAELVDEVIIQYKGTSNINSEFAQKLAELLNDVTDKQTLDLSSKIIGLMLENNTMITKSDIISLAKKLTQKDQDDAMLVDLQRLAKALEKERVEVAARMRGASFEKLL